MAAGPPRERTTHDHAVTRHPGPPIPPGEIVKVVFASLIGAYALGFVARPLGGAVLMAAEHGQDWHRGFWSSWPQAGVAMGNLLATGVLLLLAEVQSDEGFKRVGLADPVPAVGRPGDGRPPRLTSREPVLVVPYAERRL